MECLHRCFGKTDEPDENLYSSLQEVIKGLKNIKDKQPESAEGMKNFITNMAQKYDRQIEENKAMAQKYNQQIKDIENMKKIINDITNSTKKIEELKEITSGLKNIEDNDKLNDVIGKITYNLLAVIKELKKSKDEEEQLLISLQKFLNKYGECVVIKI